MKISVIIPVFNESDNITVMVNCLLAVFDKIDKYSFDILFVDDGSTDDTLDTIKKNRLAAKCINYISLSRNFGHQNALRAGLEHSDADAVITMDGDLEHPPELIIEMLNRWELGFNVVYTIRHEHRHLNIFKSFSSNMFYSLLQVISEIELKQGMADFRLLDKKVVQALKHYKESDIFYRGLIAWIGFNQSAITYFPGHRHRGKSKYSIRKMIRLALNGITSFSLLPLRITASAGVIIAFISFFYGVYAVTIKLIGNNFVTGWPSVMAGIYFLGGIQLIALGLIGEYLGRVFMEVKGRPNYVITESSIPYTHNSRQ
ncbi:MAG TPA: glycosyltransferase [Bacteroidales bacterium]|nr:glycosyltransferase [Bacteroidales bacterium]